MIGCQAYYEYLRGCARGQRAQRVGDIEISEVPFYGHA